jgi:23S rRNA pseudouridine1911/1915/1917 synthase
MLDTPAVIDIHIPATQATELVPEAIPLAIVFENTDLLVINKPAGMVAHPSPGHYRGTLVHAALAHAPEMEGVGGELRPGVVHRLDRDTSGLILLAKNDAAHHWLQNQFRDRQVVKAYLALVDGHPPTPTGRIEAPIGRNTSHRQLMTVVDATKGREAITEYHTLEAFPQYTLLEAHPLTGRTHQIRVHLKFLGCPVAGDSIYGKKHTSLPLERHFLHAARLTITLPGEKAPRTFEAPLPDDLQAVLDMLRASR